MWKSTKQQPKKGDKKQMNNATLSGRLVREPDVRYGGQDNSTAIARFTLAVDDYNGTDFIACRALGKVAEWVQRWCQKGTKIELVGKIKTGSYEKQGQKVYYTEVLASSCSFGETKAEAESRGQQPQARPQQNSYDDFMNIPDDVADGLPFN